MVRLKHPEVVSRDPHDLAAQLPRFLEWMRDRAYSEETVYEREHRLREFVAWCEERDIRYPSELTTQVLELYQRHLARRPKDDGELLMLQTQHNYLIEVRAFCRWMTRAKLVLYNPAAELVLPRLSSRIPRNVLTPDEAERVINAPDVTTPLGLRDRAMLEVLYSTGIRRAELAHLATYDLDVDRGTILVREGKYRKDRTVPIGERALAWTLKYLAEVRPDYVVPPDDGAVFLTRHGKGFVPNGVSELVTKAVDASGISKQASAHTFRHTMATVMLEGGADVRYIQEMLGHGSLTTTEVYTRVSIRALKEVHDATHPSARLARRSPGSRPDEERAAKEEMRSVDGPRILLDDEQE